MAAVEKVCECPKGDCVYHAGDMYEHKRNHLQINPECRGQFKGLTAKCIIVSMSNSTSDWVYFRVPSKNCAESVYVDDGFIKENGLYYTGSVHYTNLRDKAVKQYIQYGVRLFTKPYVAVYVKEHDKVYINWLDSVKNIRAFKRNMRKLFGYAVPTKTNLKFKQSVSCDELVRNMFEEWE